MAEAMWVFGYGSLIWNPEFPVAEQRVARLYDWQRSFCMWSIHHRGTETDPGLVLALDHAAGKFCDGVGFRVQAGAEEATLAALRERELVSSAYLERRLPIDLAGGERVEAVAYVIDPEHVQYCHLDLNQQAAVIAKAVGGRGTNRDYLIATAAHLAALGIEDADLTWLAAEVQACD
jgi:glutathione-specific gamma-glutamylcyclotransferase